MFLTSFFESPKYNILPFSNPHHRIQPSMTTTICTTIGALYPCLYSACSRVCILDEADYITHATTAIKAATSGDAYAAKRLILAL